MKINNIICVFLLQVMFLSCTEYVSDEEYNQLMSQKESLENKINDLKFQSELSEQYEALLVEYDELKLNKRIYSNRLKKAHERYSKLLKTTNRFINGDPYVSLDDIRFNASYVSSMLEGSCKIDRYKNGVLVQSDTIIYDN